MKILNTKLIHTSLTFFVLWIFVISKGFATSHLYYPSDENVREKEVQPGDTILLTPGVYSKLYVSGLHGTADSAIVITNYNGTAIFESTDFFAFNFHECSNFKLLGNGCDTVDYGIHVREVSGGAGLYVGGKSFNFDLCYLKIEHTKSAGMLIKSDPSIAEENTREKYVMRNVRINHNYFSNTGIEAIYAGSTKYNGQTVSYNDEDTVLYPHLIRNVELAYNYCEYTGWDGIQLSSADSAASIHHNVICYDGRDEKLAQMSGIILGGGSAVDCYNNHIENGNGTGILVFGKGDTRIFNNVIVRPGAGFQTDDASVMIHGIFVDDRSDETGYSINIFNNTIIEPKTDGIRFKSENSANSHIANNAIISPGAYYWYDSLATSTLPEEAYVKKESARSDFVEYNNGKYLATEDAGFADYANNDFTLLPTSPLIDNGADLTTFGIIDDYNGDVRPQGKTYDIGAYESGYMGTSIANNLEAKIKVFVSNGMLQLESSSLIKRVFIYALSGKLMKQQNVSSLNRVSVDVKSLHKGIYLVSCVDNNGDRFTQKVLL